MRTFPVVRTAASAVLPPSTDGANKRGERSNAASVGTCKADNIQSRRRLRKTADTQAERQRVVEGSQIVLQQHLAGTRFRRLRSSSSARLPMRGSRGTPLAFLWGVQRGVFSSEREYPPLSRAAPKGAAIPPARRAKAPLADAQGAKKEPPFQAAPFHFPAGDASSSLTYFL